MLIGSNSAYNYAVTKDIVRQVLGDYLQDGAYSQAGAIQILDAAVSTNLGKTKDLTTGAILAIGDVGTPAQETDVDELVTGVYSGTLPLSLDSATKAAALIQDLADVAVKNMKANTAGTTGFAAATMQARVNDISATLLGEIQASGANALLDDAVKGIVKGSKSLVANGVTLAATYAAISSSVSSDALSQAHAIAGIARTIKGDDLAARSEALTSFNGVSTADATNSAVFDGYFNSVNDPVVLTNLVTADPTHAEYIVLGAASLWPALSDGGVQAVVAGVPSLTLQQKKDIVSYVARAQNSKASKAAGAAVRAGGLTAQEALAAALPHTLSVYAASVVKQVIKDAPTVTAADIVTATIDTLEGAAAAKPEDDFKKAIATSITEVIKAKKADASNILAAGVAALANGSGYREAVAAAVGANDNKVSTAHIDALTTALTTAGASPEEIASVLKAEQVARLAKTNKAGALNLAQTEMRTGPATNLGAVLLGAGIVDKTLVNVLLAGALRNGTSLSSGDKSLLLAHAKSVNLAAEGDVQLAYDVASQVLADKDELFDIVDHRTLMAPKSAATIATAAAAAAPEYAHFVAHASGFRADKANIAKIPAAVIRGADMNSNTDENPSALAAIAAGFVCGIKEQKQIAATEEKMLAAGVTALVKAAMGYDKGLIASKANPTPSGSFRSVNITTGAAPTAANQPEYSSAGAVTGITSILSNVGDTAPSASLLIALRAAGKAVGKATNSQMTVIAQAAAQAAILVSGSAGYNVLAIADAIYKGAFNVTTAIPVGHPIAIAAQAGASEAALGNKGAGALGVLNYAHFNCQNSPVTDISNF
jgi:hypothetical protein